MRVSRSRAWIYLALLALAVGLVIYWWPDLSDLWLSQWRAYLVATSLMMVATYVQARNFLAFVDGRSSARVPELMRIWALGALANYAGPLQPGLGVRVFYLRQRGIGLSDSISATLRQLIASVAISLVGFALALLLINARKYAIYAGVLAVILILAVALRSSIIYWLEWLKWRPVVARKDWILLVIRYFPLEGVFGVVLQYGIGTILLLFVYAEFGAQIGVGPALLMACAVYVSSLVAILPGNFAVLEAIYAVGAHSLGLSATEAVALALLLRAAHVSGCILLAATPSTFFKISRGA